MSHSDTKVKELIKAFEGFEFIQMIYGSTELNTVISCHCRLSADRIPSCTFRVRRGGKKEEFTLLSEALLFAFSDD